MSEKNPAALNFPYLSGERCVHAHITQASCRACMEACHANAWNLENRQLELNSSICDGCGVCASVCPETAIEHTHNPLSIYWRDEQLVLIACEKVPELAATQTEGIINCVHALSLSELTQLYAAGHRRLLISTAPCGGCSRGSIDYLNQHLSLLNTLLEKNAQPAFERINISGEQWLNIVRSADHAKASTSLSRRQFLRTTAGEISDYGLTYFDLQKKEQNAQPPIVALLPNTLNEPVLPFVPVIDEQSCTACDTCIKLCPHQALVMDKLERQMVYQIDALHCTGCAICIDVCEDNAIQIKRNTVSQQQLVTLHEINCQACGVRFHTLDARAQPLCPICQKKKHHTAIFQMLD